MPLFRKKPKVQFDPNTQEPAILKSICTGEMTAGFVDKSTGKFQDLMSVKDEDEFKKILGVDHIKIIY